MHRPRAGLSRQLRAECYGLIHGVVYVFAIGYTEDMSAIDLYNLFRRIPDATEAEARAAADTIAHTDDVVTKGDLAKLESKIAAKIAELEMRLTWRIIITVGIFNSVLFLALRFTS